MAYEVLLGVGDVESIQLQTDLMGDVTKTLFVRLLSAYARVTHVAEYQSAAWLHDHSLVVLRPCPENNHLDCVNNLYVRCSFLCIDHLQQVAVNTDMLSRYLEGRFL